MGIKDTIRKIPGVASVEGAVTGAVAEEQDLPIAGYDSLSAADIAAKLKGLSQRDLRTIDAYERKRQNRTTVTDKIAKLTGDEPWSGYDEQSVDQITAALAGADAHRAQKVKAYERDRKGRVGVMEAAERRIDRAA
jgi:SpoVK/Ycf46/Vps4 family AAA+-type ATPase